ncbi:hypothetical protein L596_012174 [Steinernema carpocapsae]|uniref:G-protein coupled receptors family 1 profile domain-containing protein n=1 Tax=Steinernema carpocapsae TaxID=34508 RepID=A0A4U5NW71_STECR|nr:hypothetical protein L596_012174 [Steinernema carpocapsae]
MTHEHHVFMEIEACLFYLKKFVQYGTIVLAFSIVFLSIKYVRSSLIRTYTLNLCFAGLSCALYSLFRPLFDPLLEEDLIGKTGVVIDNFIHVLMLFPALVLHEVQGTLLIALTYMCFSKPMRFRDVFSKRNVWISFILGNILSVFLGFAMYIEEMEIINSLAAIRVHDVFRFVVELCLISVMFTCYFRTFYVLFIMNNASPLEQSSTEKRNRASLQAVLIYCTTPNVFLVLGICASGCSMVDTLRMKVITEAQKMSHGESNILMYFAKNTIMIRLFISLACALLAFPQYREATTQFMNAITKRPSVIKVEPTRKMASSRMEDTCVVFM